MKKVYMDHSAGMPVDSSVLEAMLPYFSEFYGNPSSIHSYGQEAKNAVENARKQVATLINAKNSSEILFTSGGTESNNIAIKGYVFRNKSKGNHIITTAIEHISILNIFKYLSKNGFDITIVPVDSYGLVEPESIRKSITDKTILLSVMYANGEIGTLEPIKEIGEIAKDKGIAFHVDAVAAAGKISIEVEKENINLLSISSNDFYGPKGVGALYVKEGIRIEPLIQGGGQERGYRSGSENVPGIVGMGKAAELAKTEMEADSKRLTVLRDKFVSNILSAVPKAFLNGHPTKRLPNNINIRFNYIEGESLILSLDEAGIACSSGSACTSKTLEPSHVLTAIGLPHEEAHGSLQFSLGRHTKDEDIDYVLSVLPKIVKRLRAMSPLTPKELL